MPKAILPPPFDLTAPEAIALHDALMTYREEILQRITLTLARRSDVQSSQSGSDGARRLAGILYGNLIAALTFGTFAPFRHDIIWHLTLLRRRKLPVTLDDERAMFASVAEAVSIELPEHADTVHALFAHVIQMIATIRTEEFSSVHH